MRSLERIFKMSGSSREELINNLAEAMGAATPSSTRYTDGKYDSETGTFYCNGHVITAGMIDKAMLYYENMRQRAASNPDMKEMMLIYELALESIRMLRKDPNKVNKVVSSGYLNKK